MRVNTKSLPAMRLFIIQVDCKLSANINRLIGKSLCSQIKVIFWALLKKKVKTKIQEWKTTWWKWPWQWPWRWTTGRWRWFSQQGLAEKVLISKTWLQYLDLANSIYEIPSYAIDMQSHFSTNCVVSGVFFKAFSLNIHHHFKFSIRFLIQFLYIF